jgi:broad specificity phosphatase PhoE
MILKSPAISRVLLIRPGATDFDDQRRIKGSLDMPLSAHGRQQAARLVGDLADVRLKTIYTSPGQSARETAAQLARGRDIRIKVIEAFRNIDHGLWHGKLIEEVRRNHPKVYRTGQDTPSEICPPGGEPISDAQERVKKSLRKCMRKGGDGVVAFVIPDPMATVIQAILSGEHFQDLWKAETDAAQWQLIESKLH